jgi:PmbA protein
MSDLLDMARATASLARTGEQVEAYLVHDHDFQVKVYKGEVESLSSAEPRGAGVRVVAEGKTGFVYSSDISEEALEDAVARGRENARYGTEDPAVGLAELQAASSELPGLIDPAQESTTPEDKVALALELERATLAADSRIRGIEEAAYADSDTTVAIATSTGIEGSYRRTDAWCYVIAIGSDGDEQEMGFDFDLARGLQGLDVEQVAGTAARKAVATLGAGKIPSARMPVVFDPYVAAQFLGVLGTALTGEAVQKGRSLFKDKLGEQVAASGITLIDDGRLLGAPGSSPWDAEGVPTGRTEVVKEGTLNSFLYDTTSARREGRTSTGNASRAGFKSVPHPSPSNLAFVPTGQSAREVLKSAGKAFLVQDFHGVHSGANPVSGDFSVGATGMLIEDGDETRPVKEVTIAAPMLEILKRTVAVADDIRWLPFGGSLGGATTLVSEMTVAGSN